MHKIGPYLADDPIIAGYRSKLRQDAMAVADGDSRHIFDPMLCQYACRRPRRAADYRAISGTARRDGQVQSMGKKEIRIIDEKQDGRRGHISHDA